MALLHAHWAEGRRLCSRWCDPNQMAATGRATLSGKCLCVGTCCCIVDASEVNLSELKQEGFGSNLSELSTSAGSSDEATNDGGKDAEKIKDAEQLPTVLASSAAREEAKSETQRV